MILDTIKVNGMTNNKEATEEYLKTLRQASEHWFYGYAWTEDDQLKLKQAMIFFTYIEDVQKRKVEKELNNA